MLNCFFLQQLEYENLHKMMGSLGAALKENEEKQVFTIQLCMHNTLCWLSGWSSRGVCHMSLSILCAKSNVCASFYSTYQM